MPHRLEFRRYSLPFRSAVRTAHGPWPVREGLIIRTEDEAGRVGYGEAAAIPWFGSETVEEDVAGLVGLGGAVDAGSLQRIDERLGSLRFAVACALGAEQGLLPAVQRLPVASLLPAGKAACAAADQALEAGYVAFKWKVGVLDDADERVILDDLLARLPGHVKLRLDANGAWTTRRAMKWLACCAERPIEFVEQPVAPDAVDALAGLAADYPTTLALDESVAGLPGLRTWLGREAGARRRSGEPYGPAGETPAGRRFFIRIGDKYRPSDSAASRVRLQKHAATRPGIWRGTAVSGRAI